MKYTKEQIDIMIKSACDTQKEIDYNVFINIIKDLSINDFIDYDVKFTENNLDVKLNKSDFSEIRDCWIDIDIDIIKSSLLEKLKNPTNR